MTANFGIDISILPSVWRDCTGHFSDFASGYILRNITPPSGGYSTRNAERFSAPQLNEPLFYEAQHYADRAIYHLIIGKWMIAASKPTWGMVSYYYSAFFSAQCAIRLGGSFFAKLNYDSEVNVPPTHRIDVVNLTRGEYQIRQTAPKGEHQRVWATFYDRYWRISDRSGWQKFGPVTAISGEEERLAEMHRRHLLNYVPGGAGYLELRSPRDATEWCDRLNKDLPSDLARHINDDDCQLEVRALMRFELCQLLFQKIADEGGAYSIHHPKISARRLDWVAKFDCPSSLARHLERVLSVPV